MFNVALQGENSLMRALDALGQGAARRVMRPAVNAALTPLNKAAKRLCPKDSGNLRRSIGKKVSLPRRGGDTVWGGVGPRKGYPDDPGMRVHLTEFGTIHSAAQPFLRPALDATSGQCMQILRGKVGEGIEKEVRKQRRH